MDRKEFLLDEISLMICCYVILLEFSAKPLWEIMTVSGLFSKDKNISIAGSTVNLIVSIILGKALGLAGIFIGTICTYVIQIIMKSGLLYRDRLHLNVRPYYLMWGKMNTVSITAFFILHVIRKNLLIRSCWISVIVYGLIATIMWFLLMCIFYSRTSEFGYLCKLVSNKISMLKRNSEHG